ncbi:MAG TPA: bifunctional glutamate N-acetyltransferase/amino-acid acetyltransferase ArgJ, partial [Chthoniobacterales bacterium]|nr:bifunctional glutamate N-acetyltransferase/amino-acid acetyltransferase ArgJ [Chthoniobacterales bacterium]
MHESDARFARGGWSELKNSFREISGSICSPRGFKCASVFCDIKKLGTGRGSEKGRKDDLALIVSDVPAAVAGMFTTNQVCAAPVKISRRNASAIFAHAIVVNSGNANAATGEQGMRDAQAMTRLTADVLSKLNRKNRSSLRMPATDVLVCSTGRIGVPMPMKNVERGIRDCAPHLARSASNARQVAEAIMTTDTRRKEVAVEFEIGKSTVRIGGICKGAGMIQPGMATMLAFITTDAAVESATLKRALKIAVGQSFNRITVDGDMSTNDSVVALANGMAKNSTIGRARLSRADSRGLSPHHRFQDALNFVCLELAKMIVRDGEGTSRVVGVRVRGARNDREAEAAARAIANSSLVRTSWCGSDPNWGRVLCAVGYSKAKIDESAVDVGYAAPDSRKILFAFRRGRPTNVALKALARITSEPEFDLHVDLHRGRGEFMIYAADLTEDYVAL